MDLPTHEDMKLFVDKDIKIWWLQHHNKQHHEQNLKEAYRMQWMQEEGCDNI